MKVKIDKKKITKFLFNFLLISTLIGYIGYYFYFKNHNINIYVLYSNYASYFDKISGWSNVVRFLKDGVIVLLFLWSLLFIKNKTQIKLIIASAFFYLYGITIAILNGYSAQIIIGGIRAYLYAVVLLFFFNVIDDEYLSSDSILRIITLGCLVNFIVVTEQAIRGTGGNIFLVGRGGYRVPGLFGGVNALSEFAIAAVLFVFVVDYKKKINPSYISLIYVLSLLMAVMSGTRSGIINVLIIIYVWIVGRTKLKYTHKIFITAAAGIVAIPSFIFFSSNLAGRGSILQTQLESGRINKLINILQNSSLKQLFFGRGLGVGSNSEVLLNQMNGLAGGSILDGTFNVVLYQYGLIGLLILVCILIAILRKMKYSTDALVKWLFVGTVLLQCLTGNIFEAYSFLILLFACYQMLVGNKII